MSQQRQEIAGLLLVVALPLCSFPLSWLPQQVAQDRFGVMLPVAALALVVMLLARVGGSFEESAQVSFPRAICWPSALLLVSWLVSVRFSERPHVSVNQLPSLLANFAVFLLATRFPPGQTRRLLWWWLLAAFIVAANGLVRLGSETEPVSLIGNRNFLGAYLAASIVIGVTLWDKRAGLVCLILAAALVSCRSRGAWLALGLVGAVWWLVGARAPRLAIKLGGVIIVGGGALLLLGGYLAQHWRTEVRPVIWQSTVRMIADRPLTGHGLGTFVAVYPRFRLPEYFLRSRATNVTDHAHNELLEITAEQGVLGLVATLWLWGVALARGIRSANADRLRWGLVGAALVLLLHGLLDVGLRYPPDQTLCWFLLGVLVSGQEDVRVPVRSQLVRVSLAAACLVLGGWVMVTAVIQPVLADVWERRARLAEARGDAAAAVTAADCALEHAPFRLSLRYLLAGVLSKAPQPAARQLAIAQCRLIDEWAPDYADVTFNLGQLYRAEGDATNALPYLRRAVAINPYNPDRHVALAAVLRQLGKDAELP